MTLWLVIDVDGVGSGAGASGADARSSALGTELLAMADDDSARHAVSIDAFEAEVTARARRHHVVQVLLARRSVEPLSKAIGTAPDSRVHGLIGSAVRTAVGTASGATS